LLIPLGKTAGSIRSATKITVVEIMAEAGMAAATGVTMAEVATVGVAEQEDMPVAMAMEGIAATEAVVNRRSTG
jgi:hypothetical protein